MAKHVGVKLPEVGTPASVEGIELRALPVAVGDGLAEGEELGLAEGEASPEGVAVKEGNWLEPAARIVKVLEIVCS